MDKNATATPFTTATTTTAATGTTAAPKSDVSSYSCTYMYIFKKFHDKL